MLDRSSSEQISALLSALTEEGQRRLTAAMTVITQTIAGTPRLGL
jgi:hypothetical protein